MPREKFYIVEVIAAEDDLTALRRWAGESIRDGDGIYLESGRLFLVISAVTLVDLESVLSRIQPDVAELGGSLKVHTMGTDDGADSIHRRADALVLPVEPRHD